jgi:hypothetical protein
VKNNTVQNRFTELKRRTKEAPEIILVVIITYIQIKTISYTYTMENKFIPDAIDIVSKAINADNEGEYEKALNLYRDALGRFTMGLKYGT